MKGVSYAGWRAGRFSSGSNKARKLFEKPSYFWNCVDVTVRNVCNQERRFTIVEICFVTFVIG